MRNEVPDRHTRDGGVTSHFSHFAPLLRDLVRWELVQKDDRGQWVIRDDVARFMDEYIQPAAQPHVFVGYHCQRCGKATITFESDGRHICASCVEAEAQVVDLPVSKEDLSPRVPRRWHLLHRRAG